MGKDPAFLFYPGDWLGGTLGMTFEEKGAYMDLLMLQFNRGHMTEHMIGQTVGQFWDNLKDKFVKDKEGLWYNVRLEIEKDKRKNFTDSRKNNVSGNNQYTKKEKKDLGHTTSHMENENENENENISLNESENKTIEFISEKFGITEMKHFLNYKTIHNCVVCQFNQGEELFNHFKDQIWNYFMYKQKAKEKLHSFKGFIGSPEEKFIDGGWNAENWNKKHIGLEVGEVNNGVQPKEENKNKVDYSWNKKRNYKETDLTKITISKK